VKRVKGAFRHSTTLGKTISRIAGQEKRVGGEAEERGTKGSGGFDRMTDPQSRIPS